MSSDLRNVLAFFGGASVVLIVAALVGQYRKGA